MPIIVLFWQSARLTMTEIFQLQGVFSLTVLVLELPGGYFADRVGRRIALIAAYLIWSSAYLVYYYAESFAFFLLAEILIGAAVSLESGADTALLYDSLKALRDENSFARYQGKLVFWGNVAESVTAVLGGVMATYSLRWPFLACCIQLAIASVLAYFLVEAPRIEAQSENQSMKDLFAELLKSKQLLCAFGLFSSTATATYVAIWLYQPYWKLANVPIELFGFLWAFCSFTAGLTALLVGKFRGSRIEAQLITLTSFVPGVALMIMGCTCNYASIALCALVQAARGLNSTAVLNYVHQRVGSSMRATAHSLLSAGVRLLFVLVGPCIGLIADHSGILYALFICGIFFVLVAATFRLWMFPDRSH